jgi:hypothetical protein
MEQLMSLTGTTYDEAASILLQAGGNLNTAIQFMFG